MRRLLGFLFLVLMLNLSTVSAQGNFIAYIVQPGDTLFQIAQSNNTTVAILAQVNNITNVNLIEVGQILLIPVVGGGGNSPTNPRDGEANWCYAGEIWGMGQCNNPDPSIQNYNWFVGWCYAQFELGNVPSVEACLGQEVIISIISNDPEEKETVIEEEENGEESPE